jgi:hypothetical protein
MVDEPFEIADKEQRFVISQPLEIIERTSASKSRILKKHGPNNPVIPVGTVVRKE